MEPLDHVREHSRLVFPEAWRNYDEAKAGSLRIKPLEGLFKPLANDYEAMQRMMFGSPRNLIGLLIDLGRLAKRSTATSHAASS
jgi:hypothetical protein